jgi:hypothetical protein
MNDTPETDALLLHEARSLAQAGYAKAERAEKMLRTAAAKADQWRECAEGLADAFRGVPYDPYTVGGFNAQKCKEALAEYRRLKEGGINGEPRQGWVETVEPLTIRGESGTLYQCEGTPTVVINPPARKVCRCEHPGPHSHPGSAGKFCAVCGWDISPNVPVSDGATKTL